MKGFTLIELAIVIVIAALLAAVAVPIYNGIVSDSKWSEAKTAVGTIKASVDTYKAKFGGDISGLTIAGGFGSGSALLTELKLADDAFTQLQYFDAGDFAMTFNTDGTDGLYTVTVTAGAAGGGLSGNGPTGSGTYDSDPTADPNWTGDLQ